LARPDEHAKLRAGYESVDLIELYGCRWRDARHHKVQDFEQDKAVANRSNTSPNSQQEFENVVLPRLKSELELLQKQAQQPRTEQAQAERPFEMSR
jgi:hypothetical protein